MYKKMVLLTKSKKLNGYCVTGVDLENGKWIRLMQPGEPSVSPHDFRYDDGDEPEVLDIIEVDLLESFSTELQPENIVFNPTKIVKCNYNDLSFVNARLNSDYDEHDYVYYNRYPKLLDSMLPRAAKENPYSLMIIEPERISFRKNNHKRMEADFCWKGTEYKGFRVTDENFKRIFLDRETTDVFRLDRPVYIVVSLGEAFVNPASGNTEYYKLVSAVIDKSMVDKRIAEFNDRLVQTRSDDKDQYEIYDKAKNVLEAIAYGVNPYTGELLGEESIFNYPETIRSLFTAIRLLDERMRKKVDSSGKKSRKKAFSLSHDEAERIDYSDEPLPITKVVQRINDVVDTSNMKKLTYKIIVQWFIKHGYIEEKEVEQFKAKCPTEDGRRIGISLDRRESNRMGVYFVTLYNTEAQHFIVDNIDAIVQEADH